MLSISFQMFQNMDNNIWQKHLNSFEKIKFCRLLANSNFIFVENIFCVLFPICQQADSCVFFNYLLHQLRGMHVFCKRFMLKIMLIKFRKQVLSCELLVYEVNYDSFKVLVRPCLHEPGVVFTPGQLLLPH